MTDNDPRVEAAEQELWDRVGGFLADFPCRETASAILAAADAVDPLRQPGVIHRVAKRVSEPELATAYGHGWDDPQTWKREAWREEAHALLAAVDAVDPVRAEGFAALVAALRAALRDLDPEPPLHREGS